MGGGGHSKASLSFALGKQVPRRREFECFYFVSDRSKD